MLLHGQIVMLQRKRKREMWRWQKGLQVPLLLLLLRQLMM
jgi:hypothetical protein